MRPLALIILDGWGYNPSREGNAIALASAPCYAELSAKYPRTLLAASGERVGLPRGAVGNSEAGHLNIGAGRVVRTGAARIDQAIETGEFFANEVLLAAMERAKTRGAALHMMGLVSDGMVHSSQEHLYALLRMAKALGLERVFVHCFLDGRDAPPLSAYGYVEALQVKCSEIGCGQIATLVGRYYAMDRDRRWERTRRAYEMLIEGRGERAFDPVAAIKLSYLRGVTDEFVEPVVITPDGHAPVASIEEGDAVIFFNIRADRARQLTSALAVPGFDAFRVPNRPAVDFVCFTEYDKTYPLAVAFPFERPRNILAEVFARKGVRNCRFAETEKYAHVTYFFNGGTEREFPYERRVLVPSPKVATYDLAPEMSAFEITDLVLRSLDESETDVLIVNFANPDMVGHTGNLEKAVEAVQRVDACLGRITKRVGRAGGICLIAGDHGNCEQMVDRKTGQPHTAHTTNPVPFHLIDEAARGLSLRGDGALKDIAPTILALLKVEKPPDMTGRDLRST